MAQGKDRKFMILFDSATSPDGKSLIACSALGELFIWNISSIFGDSKCTTVTISDINHETDSFTSEDLYSDDLNSDDEDIDFSPSNHSTNTTINTNLPHDDDTSFEQIAVDHRPSFVLHPFCGQSSRGPIYRLKTVGDILSVGSYQSLILYRWKDILSAMNGSETDESLSKSSDPCSIEVDPLYRYTPPQIEYTLGAQSRFLEINAIEHDDTKNCLYLGTGHSSIFRFDLHKSHSVESLKGHKDYVLDLSLNSTHSLMSSASDDGTLKLWDLRQNEWIESFHGGEENAYFVNCCQIHENGKYLVGGFGMKQIGNQSKRRNNNKMCMFELNVRTKISEFIHNDNCVPQVIRFSSGWRRSTHSNLAVVAGFNHSDLRFYDHGKETSSKPLEDPFVAMNTSSKSVWSIHYEPSSDAVFVTGASNKIDCIANTGNITTSLTV